MQFSESQRRSFLIIGGNSRVHSEKGLILKTVTTAIMGTLIGCSFSVGLSTVCMCASLRQHCQEQII